ncbi:hypothetical protein L6164_020926 [Bauhinia variegata]|uniref:Uncharacterized protein n=1 Tax=Bauhinia variegata TaxID=167791 RepID=A0ACB9MY36_BAUVA|nr:hypothetical protein L6164_020926 [Bauhinia variegata]
MGSTSQNPPSYPDKLDTTLSKLLDGQHTIQQTQTAFQTDLHSLTAKVAFLESKLSHNPSPTNESSSTGFVLPFQSPFLPHNMKLDVPKFDGSDPLGWSFKINQFFDFHRTLEDHKLRIASSTWKEKLSSVSIKLSLSNWQIVLLAFPTPFYLSCFISGLKPEIRCELSLILPPTKNTHKPSLPHLLFFLQKRHLSTNPIFPPLPPRHHYLYHLALPSNDCLLPSFKLVGKKGFAIPVMSNIVLGTNVKKPFMLFAASLEMSEISDKQNPNLTLFLTNPTQPMELTSEALSDHIEAQISFHALMGYSIPRTLRVQVKVGKLDVVILVNGGCTHNFIQEYVAKFLGLTDTPTHSFHVMVGSGHELGCHSFCPQVPITIKDHTYHMDLYLLPLFGADIVLGVQWMKSLGPVLTDYNTLSMKFIRDGHIVELVSQSFDTPSEINYKQIKRMVDNESIVALFHIEASSCPSSVSI